MASELATLMARFLQVYRHDPASLRRYLESNSSDEISCEDPPAVLVGDQIAAALVKARTLVNSALIDQEAQQLLSTFPEIASVPFDVECHRRSFERLNLDPLAAFLAMNREDVVPWLIDEIRTKNSHDLSEPDFGVYFTREFLVRLDDLVSRVEGLEELEYGDIVSDNLRSLFQEAHRCYLYGFDVSAAIMCGAILEQALKETLKLGGGMEMLLETAEGDELLSPVERGMGDDVRVLRNEAVHDYEKFMRRRQEPRATLLSNTRRVVKTLLSAKSSLKNNEGSQQ